MMEGERLLNTEIARLTYMTNGRIGRDHRSGLPFVIGEKGREWDALVWALDVLQAARSEIARLAVGQKEAEDG